MAFTQFVTQIAVGSTLPLVARLSDGALWQRVGIMTRTEAHVRVRFASQAAVCLPAWIECIEQSKAPAGALSEVVFGVVCSAGTVREIARGWITRATLRASREVTRAQEDGLRSACAPAGEKRPARRGAFGGGPRGLHSSWPDACRVAAARRSAGAQGSAASAAAVKASVRTTPSARKAPST